MYFDLSETSPFVSLNGFLLLSLIFSLFPLFGNITKHIFMLQAGGWNGDHLHRALSASLVLVLALKAMGHIVFVSLLKLYCIHSLFSKNEQGLIE